MAAVHKGHSIESLAFVCREEPRKLMYPTVDAAEPYHALCYDIRGSLADFGITVQTISALKPNHIL